MNLTNIEHIEISDKYTIHTDKGSYVLQVIMNPQIETEPMMEVLDSSGSAVDSAVEDAIIEMFLSVGKNEIEQQ